MNSHRCTLSIRDFGTIGRPWPIDTRSLVKVFAWPMFPDIALRTAIHAVAVSGMPAADATVGEGSTDDQAEAPLEADAADGIDAPDVATGIDAGMPPRVAADVAGASPVGKTLLATGQTPPPTAIPTIPGKAACFPPLTFIAATLRRPAMLLQMVLPLDDCCCCCCCCCPAAANRAAAAASCRPIFAYASHTAADAVPPLLTQATHIARSKLLPPSDTFLHKTGCA